MSPDRPLVGTVLSVPDVALAELTGTPFDFAWVDLEHGALSPRDAQQLAIALRAAGCAAYVRLPSADSDLLAPIVDAGVDGVVVPRVEAPEEAATLVHRLRHPPAGSRGFGPRRAGSYGRFAAGRVECVVQVETAAGVERAERIALVDGVDALVVGCSDLSRSLGVPEDLTGQTMRTAIGRVAEAARVAGVRFGIAAAGDPTTIARLAGGGAAMVVYSVDVRLYARAVDGAAHALRTALGTPGRAELGPIQPEEAHVST